MAVLDNPLDWLDERLSSAGAADELGVDVGQHADREKDATLVLRHPEWVTSTPARHSLDQVTASGDCRVLRQVGNRLDLRFDDRLLAELGDRLERRPHDPLRTRELHRGRAWVVNFIDPNTTKALHIGHLRNIAVGHSLASAGEAAGIAVTRQIRVGDYGRNMGEAMAGYLAYGDGRTPEKSGVRGDRLVGECYARYVSTLAPQPDGPRADVALTREGHVAQDAADELLDRWRSGDEEAVRLFEAIRQWVLDGHDETYARLGMAIDRVLFESDRLDDLAEIVTRGLDTGLFRRSSSGAIVYDTGDAEYERYLLARMDGFPTQHLRYMATWSGTRKLYDGAETIDVLGMEWRHMVKYTGEILGALHPPEERHPGTAIIYEMVVSEAGVIKSSKGDVLLVDEILDEIAGSEQVTQLRRSSNRVTGAEVAAIVALARFLVVPVRQRVTIQPGTFDDPNGPGWQLASAWARAWDSAYDGDSSPDPDELDYRFLVVRSSLHRRLLRRCIDHKDVLPLLRFDLHLACWFNSITPTPRVARAVRSVLGEGLVALGLHPTGVPGRCRPTSVGSP